MKLYTELEDLNFFEWLAETHNLADTDMKPEYLDELPIDDIHTTVCNAMAFRWFREKHLLEGLVLPQDKSVPDPLPIYFIAVISYEGGEMNELFNSTSPINMLHYSEYEEAQLGCLRHLIKIVKENEN